METYLVGGAVRDKLLGKKPKDLDYTVVLSGNEDGWRLSADPFKVMIHELKSRGFKIFLETPQYFTARAQHPNRKETADFVLARSEGEYSDGRRPDEVRIGNLYSDLSRRDFTMNAIAINEFGNFIDPFDGEEDIEDHIIRAVGNAKDRLMEDALRALRAIRFSIQLGFGFHAELLDALHDVDVFYALRDNIADERKMDELNKMFKIDAVSSILVLNRFNKLMVAAFDGKVNLEATMKQKGFNK